MRVLAGGGRASAFWVPGDCGLALALEAPGVELGSFCSLIIGVGRRVVSTGEGEGGRRPGRFLGRGRLHGGREGRRQAGSLCVNKSLRAPHVSLCHGVQTSV